MADTEECDEILPGVGKHRMVVLAGPGAIAPVDIIIFIFILIFSCKNRLHITPWQRA